MVYIVSTALQYILLFCCISALKLYVIMIINRTTCAVVLFQSWHQKQLKLASASQPPLLKHLGSVISVLNSISKFWNRLWQHILNVLFVSPHVS